MTSSIRQFSGKRMDTVVHMTHYIMDYMGGEKIYAPEGLTFRPFFRKYAEGEKTRFIKPYVSAATGFDCVFTLCRTPGVCVRSFPDADSLFENYRQNDFAGNPVIMGPFSKKKIWNRMDSLFYDNKSYFLIVVDKKQDSFIFHDPEGTPYCMADEEFLKEALDQKGETILAVEMGKAGRDGNVNGYIDTFWSGLRKFCVQVQQDTLSGAEAWKPLRILLEEEFSSSAQMCLYYNIMEIQQACQSTREFFSFNSFVQWNQEKNNLLEKHMQHFERCCASVLEGVLRKDTNSIKHDIEDIMYLEHELLALYLMLSE